MFPFRVEARLISLLLVSCVIVQEVDFFSNRSLILIIIVKFFIMPLREIPPVAVPAPQGGQNSRSAIEIQCLAFSWADAR